MWSWRVHLIADGNGGGGFASLRPLAGQRIPPILIPAETTIPTIKGRRSLSTIETIVSNISTFPGIVFMRTFLISRPFAGVLLVAGCLMATGCASYHAQRLQRDPLERISGSGVPRELEMASLPIYRVEPPDVLLLQAVNNIRPESDVLRAGDVLIIQGTNLLPLLPIDEDNPDPTIENQWRTINSEYLVQPDGKVDLGPVYGAAKVAGLTLNEAKKAVERHVKNEARLREPKIAVSLPPDVLRGRQPIDGTVLVRPDGTISLGIYGSVHVAGMTLDEVKQAVEELLSQHLHKPEIRVEIEEFNSKEFYIIIDQGGLGDEIISLPITGNDTILSAMAHPSIGGLPDVSSKRIWVARPGPAGLGYAQTMKVDWRAITQDGVTTTNYQLFPNDRIFIKADDLITLDNVLGKIQAPIERVSSMLLISWSTLRRIAVRPGATFGNPGGGGGGGGGFGGF